MTKKLPVILAAAAAAALALIPAQRAVAQQVTFRVDTPEFGFRIGTPVYPAPVVIGTAPVYAPPPVVYTPPPRVIYQPPVVYAPPHVVMGPRPLYVAPRPVYVAPRPVYVTPRWTPPGQRHGYYRSTYPRGHDGYRY